MRGSARRIECSRVHRWRWVSGVVFAVMFVSVAIYVNWQPFAPPPSPLAKPGGSQAGGVTTDVGHPFSFADLFITNVSDGPLTLDSVEMVDPSPGLKIVGEQARAANEGSFQLAGDDDYPPTGKDAREMLGNRHPLRGFVIKPKSAVLNGAQLVIGIVTTRHSRMTIREFEIRLHDQHGHHFTYTAPYAIAVCTPAFSPCESIDPPPL